MSNRIFLVTQFIQHWLRSGNEHSIHSPFLFELYCNTVQDKNGYYCFEEIEKIRKDYLSTKKSISIQDFGAGSSVNKNKNRRVSDIAKNSLTPKDQCQFLFKLVQETKPINIIELGTSLGITTSYFAAGNQSIDVHTIEACEETRKIAKNTFQQLNLKNIHSYLGTFQNILPEILNQVGKVGLAFIDGHHAYQPTIDYFKLILKHSTEDTILVFDDIYWSPEMKKAWEEIISHPEVKLSVDLYYFGLVFLRKNQPKQHFDLRF